MELNDLQTIRVRRVQTQKDYENAIRVRHVGYAKYGLSLEQVSEPLDTSPQATILIAEDEQGQTVGTMRILDRTLGMLELDTYVDLTALLSPHQCLCAEATRLSVPASPLSPCIKNALWKAYHRYCLANQLTTMVIWARPAAARDYRMLMFEDLGPNGSFVHPVLGNRRHNTFALDLTTAESQYREVQHPLHAFLFCQKHANIRFF